MVLPKLDSLRIPVSVGELLDKIAILAVKRENMVVRKQRENVSKEYYALRYEYAVVLGCYNLPIRTSLAEGYGELVAVNRALWVIEDDIRLLEREGNFGELFVYLARQVYKTNDKRSAIKRKINDLSGSSFVEEKQYAQYKE